MVGHSFGAAGAIESVACVQTIQTGWIHPTINYEFPDPDCDLDYVPNQKRQADVERRALEQLRLRRAERLPGLQAVRGSRPAGVGRRYMRAASMRASDLPVMLPRPDRPWVWTVATLLVLVVCIGLLLVLPLLVLLFGGGVCVGGSSPTVVDETGRVIQQGQELPRTCDGPSTLTVLSVLAIIEAIPLLGIVLCVGSLRSLGARWNSPLFSPIMWTIGTGAVVALLVLIASPSQWWFTRTTLCDGSGCTSSTSFEPVVALVWSVVVATLAIPFLLSLRRLVTTWLSLRPAR